MEEETTDPSVYERREQREQRAAGTCKESRSESHHHYHRREKWAGLAPSSSVALESTWVV